MISVRLGVLAALAALLTGCAGTKTDVSDGIEDLNRRELAPLGAEIDCPDEVDGAEGTEFECTLKGTQGDETRKVRLKIVERDGDLLVAPAQDAEFDRAVSQVGAQ
ncbi:MAG: DUF4333 domain-containing protein [Actinomycetota bacterium]|nr:DUF4333 domain-containing protein [Actinomycetota bacterium]MDQ5808134.1 DUF4333 domain-containing protein [Actinomycetota bacterium]